MNFDALEEQIEHSAGPEPKIFTYYFNVINTRIGQYCIISFWVAMIISLLTYGRDLLDLTNFVFNAPSGTDGYDADAKFNANFPVRAASAELLLYYKCTNCTSEWNILSNCNNSMYNISMTMNSSLYEYNSDHGNSIINGFSDYYTTISHATVNDSTEFLATAKTNYFNSDCTAGIGIIYYDSSLNSNDKSDLINNIKSTMDDLNSRSAPLETELTGQAALLLDMNEESHTDVERKDVLTIPIALSVLALIVRSWRLMFIPIICVLASLATSFTIMTPIAASILQVNPFAPSIMVSVTIAMSIDYSLFLLTRFREEMEKKKKGVTVQHSVRQMIRWSGKVVALSGFILSITYVGLVFYPMSMLQSVGLGASIAIVCTIVVNLTLTPALLLLFPNFFSQFGCTFKCPKQYDTDNNNNNNINDTDYHAFDEDPEPRKNSGDNNTKEYSPINDEVNLKINSSNSVNQNKNNSQKRDILSSVSNPAYQDTTQQNNNSPSLNSSNGDGHLNLYQKQNEVIAYDFNVLPADERENKCNRCWYTIGFFTSQFPYNIIIIIVVYALISPIGWRITELNKQLDDTLIFPRDSSYLTTYNEVKQDFEGGLLAPFYIQIPILDNEQTVWSEIYFNDSGVIIDYVNRNLIKLYNISLSGISWNNKAETLYTWDFYEKILANDYTYEYFTASFVNGDNSSSYFNMITSFDPFNADAPNVISNMRDVISRACNKEYNNITNNYNCYLSGGSVDEVDCVNTIFTSFPWVLAIIIGVVFSLMGFFFTAVFIPIRLFLTITVPMTLVYGLSILVYQKGLLTGLNADEVANTDGLYWIVPVMTVTILCGLALDYDVFLFARIYEYRMAGLSTRQSIIFGVYKTGSIITAAGCIMAIAFCGLLLSQITSLNQTGFILVVAVIVDTFVIRTLLVPAILSLVKEVNWWPGIDPRCDWFYRKNSQQIDHHSVIKMERSGASYNNNIKSPLL